MTITQKIEEKIAKKAERDVESLLAKLIDTYKAEFGISYQNAFTHKIDAELEALVKNHIEKPLIAYKTKFYNDKFFEQLESATELLARFLGEAAK